MTNTLQTTSPRRSMLPPSVNQPVVWVLLLDVALIVVFGLLSPGGVFFSAQSFANILAAAGPYLLLAVAAAVLLSSGQFDLSLGAMLVLSSAIAGQTIVALVPSLGAAGGIIAGAVVALAVGAVCGAVSGVLVSRLRINSLIATLAATGVFTGVTFILTGGADIVGIPAEIQSAFGAVQLLEIIPLPLVAVAVVIALVWWMMRSTRVGLRILSTGSSRVAAERAGVNTKNVLLGVFILGGLLAGAAGFLDLTRFGTTNIGGHQTDSLAATAAAVIGGTALTGGRLSIGGALAGALLAVILQAGLVIIGLPSFFQLIAVGVVLILAVYLNERRSREQS